jgi:hypothetical protein
METNPEIPTCHCHCEPLRSIDELTMPDFRHSSLTQRIDRLVLTHSLSLVSAKSESP